MIEEEGRVAELREFGASLGVRVENIELLDRALTHASITSETEGPRYDYEALEFLGDAALDLAIAHHLFKSVPERTPGEYSKMRAGLVNKRTLARVAKQLNIAPLIRLGRGEERCGGRSRASLLADCLEAVVGVIYLDCGWDATQVFIQRIFGQEIADEIAADRVWDYKSRLQNFCQAERIQLPRFSVVRSEGPDHRKHFEVEVAIRGSAAGWGRGMTKKEAEQNAARAALEHEGQRFS